MIKIEQKSVANKAYYHLSEQIKLGKKFKKIQVYIGKSIPNDLGAFYFKLAEKEKTLVIDNITEIFDINPRIPIEIYKDIETNRINCKYFFAQLSKKREELFWRDFAVKFIFESNSIEGSKLSETEVEGIIKKGYIKKSLDRKEIREVENSIKAFKKIQNSNFQLNQNSIKELHNIVVKGLNIESGYKKREIIVNNKKTCIPQRVRTEMSHLLNQWKKAQKSKTNQFLLAIKFHQKFELIHPFSDGNGRVGRLILNWMLMQKGYGAILFKNINRQKYFKAMDYADEGRNNKLYRFSTDVYKKTFRDLMLG